MRVIFDSNIYISALMSPDGVTARLIGQAFRNRFEIVTHRTQIDELRSVTRRSSRQRKIHEHDAGRLINRLSRNDWLNAKLPTVHRSSDPNDDWLLALAEVAAADVLVTGDKADLLALGEHGATRIMTARHFHDELGL